MTKKKPDITPKMRKLADAMHKARHDLDAIYSMRLTLKVFLNKAEKDCIAKGKKYEKATEMWMAEVRKEAKKQGVK